MLNLHTTIEPALYTKSQILALPTSVVVEGRFYIATDTEDVYLGKFNGSVQLVGKAGKDKTFLHVASGSSDTWNITHSMDKRPSVQCYNVAGDPIVGDVKFDATDPYNKLSIKFTINIDGIAILN